MRSLNKLEDWIQATPGLKRLAQAFAWRFTIVATKGPGATALPAAAAARVESPAAVALSSEHSSL
jgi:hypothetical protein